MNFSMDDSDREQFFEMQQEQAQKEWEEDNSLQALVRWGHALMELAPFKSGEESTRLLEQAMEKLKQALEIDPDCPDAEWVLGNTYTSYAVLCSSKPAAMEQFKKAEVCFRHCQEKDPSNPIYNRAVEMCLQADEFYDEVQSKLSGEIASGGVRQEARTKEAPVDDFWWDLAGWGLLAAAVTVVLLLGKQQASAAAK